MILHRQPAVEEVEGEFAQRVGADEPGAAQGQQQQGQQLGRAGILGCQSKGMVVLMVLLVDAAVQAGNPDGEQTNKQLAMGKCRNSNTTSATGHSVWMKSFNPVFFTWRFVRFKTLHMLL